MKNPIKFIYWQRIISIWVIACFFLTGLNLPLVQAQDYNLPDPGSRVELSPAYNPPIFKRDQGLPQ